MSKRITILGIFGIALFGGTSASVRAQEAAHRRYENLVQDRQRYEAEEREKDREAALEIERIRARAARQPERAQSSSGSYVVYFSGYVVPASGDPLFGTDATTYRLWNGAIMRVSGVLWPSDAATCIAYCP